MVQQLKMKSRNKLLRLPSNDLSVLIQKIYILYAKFFQKLVGILQISYCILIGHPSVFCLLHKRQPLNRSQIGQYNRFYAMALYYFYQFIDIFHSIAAHNQNIYYFRNSAFFII